MSWPHLITSVRGGRGFLRKAESDIPGVMKTWMLLLPTTLVLIISLDVARSFECPESVKSDCLETQNKERVVVAHPTDCSKYCKLTVAVVLYQGKITNEPLDNVPRQGHPSRPCQSSSNCMNNYRADPPTPTQNAVKLHNTTSNCASTTPSDCTPPPSNHATTPSSNYLATTLLNCTETPRQTVQ
ncbi:hypothetical protein Hamer_G000508 [Homarus americanus]|uniref:Uncharacterized protein n=1 Tax=Homarus americanus TaxID=6706 RepID=A0A8J5TK98_HOMAM|nr:hypothetical protein Hamer_G000508 [Homarus americanus]